MKKNLFYLSMLAIALITGSCSNDLDEGQTPAENNGNRAITFKPWANKPLRAAPTTVNTLNDFAVLATNPTAAAGSQVLINGEVVSGGNGNWSYNPAAFWPDVDAVNFFAVSPAGAKSVTDLSGATGTSALTGQNDANTGQPGIEFTLPLAPADQEDLLVANHTGTYAAEGTSGVPLNFHHALSRIKFQAKSESGADFIVKHIALRNIQGKATLDLSTLPKDAQSFDYPTDDATLSSSGYQTYWQPGSTVVDLEATLSNTAVSGSAIGWTDVVDNDDALYVIPQENAVNADYPYSTKLSGYGAGTSNDFYIEIEYTDVLMGTDVTYAVPVKAIVGSNPDASSLAFEIERQYTFRFELSGGKPIKFDAITVCDFDEVDPFPSFYTAVANGSRFTKSDTIKLEFDEVVTGLTTADFIIGGSPGAATPVKVEGSGTSWNLVVNPTATGLATVQITKTGISPDPKNIFVQSPFAEMVLVDGGGTSLGTPAQTVTLSDFYIGKYELTQKQWTDVMSTWPGAAPATGVGPNFPAYNISWEDLVGTNTGGATVGYTEKGIDYYTNGFCYLLSLKDNGGTLGSLHYRLPTEAEWEYAAKGGQKSGGFTYSGSNTIGDVAWYQANSGSATHAVGTKAKNELGIFDMSGNVYEWCSDWYNATATTYPSGATNPEGVTAGSDRVIRGGSWGSATTGCTVSYRIGNAPASRIGNVSVRLVVSL